MKIGQKLIASFLGVAGLCICIGGVGYYGLSQTTTSIQEINDVRLPSVLSLQQMETGAANLKAELGALTDTTLTHEDRVQIYDKIPEIRKSIAKSWDIYEPLPQTPEEAKMWNEFVPLWNQWRDANNQYMTMIHQFDTMNISDPQKLREHMEQFRGDHYELGSRLYVMMQDGHEIEGGDDPHQCSLGKWLQHANVDNPKFKALVESIHPYHNAYHAAVKDLKHAVAANDTETAERIYEHEIIDNSKKLCVVLADMREMAAEGQAIVAQAKNQFNTVCADSEEKAVGLLHQISELNSNVAGQAAEQGETAAQKATFITAAVVIIGSVFAIAFGFIMKRMLVKPLDGMVDRLKDIAEGEGDLTQRIDADRKDEIGELGNWFNTFIGKIHDTIAEVSGATNEVSSAATEIAASSEQIAARMEEQAVKTVEISSAVEEMSSSVADVSSRAADAAKNSVEAGKQAEHGGEVVGRTVNGMDTIANIVNDSAKSIAALGEQSEQIGQVIDVINDIADQTNLLALNAAIEAARAGEHGRGFAVVADEVRKLADRTTKATEEIGQSISGIQTETRAAVDQMRTGTESVEEGVTLANEAGTALNSILTGSREVEGMVQSIAAASEEQSAAAEEIATHINTIRSGTEESSEGAKQTAQAANQMSVNAEQLKRLVAQFKLAG